MVNFFFKDDLQKEAAEGADQDFGQHEASGGRDAGADGASVLISSDRTSVSVRLIGGDCYSDYRKAASDRGFVNACDQAELFPATVTSDGYVCTVRGRATLKEIVCGEDVLTVKAVRGLALCVRKLVSCAKDFGVDPRDFVFDYNAVAVRNLEGDYKFIYLPGLRKVKDRTCAGDLIRILFLNVSTDDIGSAEYEIIKERVKSIRSEEDPEGLINDLDRLTDAIGEGREETSFKDKVFGFLKLRQSKASGEEEAPLVCRLKGEGVIEGVSIERRIEKDKNVSLKIGRDGDWADIYVPDLFASRKHAELVVSGTGVMSLEDYSMNGISVDGKAGSFEGMNIRGTEVRIRITGQSGLLLSCV